MLHENWVALHGEHHLPFLFPLSLRGGYADLCIVLLTPLQLGKGPQIPHCTEQAFEGCDSSPVAGWAHTCAHSHMPHAHLGHTHPPQVGFGAMQAEPGSAGTGRSPHMGGLGHAGAS